MPPRDIGLRRGRALQLARGVRGQTGREALAVGPLARLEGLGDARFGERAREGGGREEAGEDGEEHEGGERERGERREEHRVGVRVGVRVGRGGAGGGR